MQSPKAILVIRFSSIGDIVLATSPLKSIRTAFPDSRIDFLTLDRFQDLLLFHPAIDRLVCLHADADIKEMTHFARNLRIGDYDLVVDLHNSLRSKWIRSKLHGIKTVVLKKPRWKRFKLFNFHLNHFEAGFSQRALYHEPMKSFLPDNFDIPLTELAVKNEEKLFAKDWLKNQNITGPFYTIIPSAAWKQKMWNPIRYAEVAKILSEKLQMQTVILGGKSDDICAKIFKENPDCIDAHGMLTFRESLSVLSLSQFAIGSDTGFMHAAEALGIPVTMIMGPTSIESGGGTQLSTSNLLSVPDLRCRPCSQNGKRSCYRKEQFCMTNIPPSSVVESALRIANIS
ncbi:MAG: glycosyltransferase family 9 protein [Candidatus Marinimicrobia bacterium]|jgi:ADP-heptose:LPS heptosyltransferase|nr:glycosyltransferase family 9 protein [Candidatus Neomarinimicrobiota bacterium]MBT3617592.1 glycosyltransferase family 9 protein [Candidatus Neomarinimicrobiota bacterium]MBT3829823.1 glycosyltransferase family 9 protein [Candidatus Neomarinimicrobiota bacterium]MBT3996819.1 glycosyltransferase family 9 protein [Candidatus Neomarinimicrobiota bacterium]MBT4280062.1 glycosyltransferase family 9 protein [Candidatus Neomarinimicrobiota bacterium]